MAVVLFCFVLVVFYYRAPEQATRSPPAVDKNAILESLVTSSHDQRIIFARGVWKCFTPVQHQRFGLKFYQFSSNVLRPVPTPAAFSQPDVVKEYRKFRVESHTIFFFEPAGSCVRSLGNCLGFSWIDIRRKACQSFGQAFDRPFIAGIRQTNRN